jgi:CAAX protease family protein
MFPVLILAVAAAGLGMTAVIGGRPGLAALGSMVTSWRFSPRLYAVLLVPPAAVLVTLFTLRLTVSPDFMPGLQLFGLPIGLVAGLFEEIGWTGYAYPRMLVRFGAARG